MSQQSGYPAATIGRLLLITPDEVARLSKAGVIPKPNKGVYEIAPVVQAYIKHVQINRPMTQAEFAELVGVNQSTVSRLISDGVIDHNSTGLQWLQGYIQRLQGQAAGRLGDESNGLDLVQERAALAREQRIAQKMKNDVASGEYAPIGLLSDVLGVASSAVVDRFDQLEGTLRKSCPGIDDEVMTVVMRVVASARNEWIRSTVKLVTAAVEGMVDDEDDGGSDGLETPELSDGGA